MRRARVDGIELEYEVRGSGEPLVLIHAGVCAGFFRPLMEQPALTSRYTMLRYHRAGYAGSDPWPGELDFARQAAQCRALMRHVGMSRAHVAGHSSSASMALQLALDDPDAVHSLALLEAARPAAPSALHEEMLRMVLRPAVERYRAGDPAGAVETWMRGLCGPGWRAALERALPDAVDEAVADADTFFVQELPAVQAWSFGPDEAARVVQPALAVLGERSAPIFRERRTLLLDWLPDVEPVDITAATHLLHVEQPAAVADALVAFFSRHPLEAGGRVGGTEKSPA